MPKLTKMPSGFDAVISDVALPLSRSPNQRLAIILMAPVVKGEDIPIMVCPIITHQNWSLNIVTILIQPPNKKRSAQITSTLREDILLNN